MKHNNTNYYMIKSCKVIPYLIYYVDILEIVQSDCNIPWTFITLHKDNITNKFKNFNISKEFGDSLVEKYIQVMYKSQHLLFLSAKFIEIYIEDNLIL